MADQPQAEPQNQSTPPAPESAVASAAAEAAPNGESAACAARDAAPPPAGFASQEQELMTASTAGGVQPFVEPDFSGSSSGPELANIELLDDVDLDVKIELGRTQMLIEDVLKLGPGSVVPLDKLAGDPVDIYVNDRLVARGEVLVLNDNFCVRVNDILSPTPELEGSS